MVVVIQLRRVYIVIWHKKFHWAKTMLNAKFRIAQQSHGLLVKTAVRLWSAQAAQHVQLSAEDEKEYRNAQPFERIPGPTKFNFIRSAMPGGKYYKIDLHELHRRLWTEYGTLVKLPGLFGRATIIMTYDPAHFEKIFRTEGAWPKRRGIETFAYYRMKVRPDVFKGCGGLVSDQGEAWGRMRTAVNPVMMQPRVIKSYVEPVDVVAREFVAKMSRMRDGNGEMPDDFGQELNQWSLESIGVIALEQRLGAMAEVRQPETDAVIKAVKDFISLAYQLEVEPSVWLWYHTKKFKQLMAAYDTMTNLVKKHIENGVERYEQNKLAGNHDHEQSVLDKLLSINKDYAIVMAYDMLIAGIDTTATSSTNLLYLLAKNQDKQELLRAEIMNILQTVESPLTQEALNQTPYFKACLKESMRVAPIVSGTARTAGRDLVLNGYQIPQDTDVAIATTIVMADEHQFPQGAKFLPERWLRENANNAALRNSETSPFAYIPFGFGPRTCIGKRFAELEIQLLITRILREFKVEWNHAPITYGAGLILSPSSNLKFKLTPL